MTTLTIHVPGKPAPKGSLRHVGHGRLVEQVKGSKPWREAIVLAAAQERDRWGWQTATGAVGVEIETTFERPKTSRHERPITRSSGDVDKLARNVLDALVDAHIIRDDSQVVAMCITKTHGQTAGATITIGTIGSAT